MATVTEPKLMTAEEFMAADLGEGTFELVRGEVIEVPPPMPKHARVCTKFAFSLEAFGRQTGHGYVLFESAVSTQRGPDTVRGPDVCFFSHARWPESEVGNGLPPVPPDLAVEVVSPGNRRGEMHRKVMEYLVAGALMVWVVYPSSRSLAIFRADDEPPLVLREGDVLENLPELPGFRCPVSDLFI